MHTPSQDTRVIQVTVNHTLAQLAKHINMIDKLLCFSTQSRPGCLCLIPTNVIVAKKACC